MSDVGERLRVIFLLEEGGDIWVIRAVQRRSSAQEPGQASDFDLLRKRIKQLRDVISVGKSDDWEVERGTDNVFSDFGTPEPSKRHLRATLASEIIRKLDVEQLSARDAGLITGMTSGDLMRIRHVKLKRFTIDQMLSILYRLNLDVNLSISLSPRRSRFVQRPITVPDHARAVADLLS